MGNDSPICLVVTNFTGMESQERIKVLCCFTRTIKLTLLCKLCALALKNTETLNEVIVRAHNLHNMIREMIIRSVRIKITQ